MSTNIFVKSGKLSIRLYDTSIKVSFGFTVGKAGNFPVKELEFKFNLSKPVILPISFGNSPDKVLLFAMKDLSFFKLPNSEGMLPVSLLMLKSKKSKLVTLPKAGGIAPLKTLEFKNNSSKPLTLRLVGIEPERLSFTKYKRFKVESVFVKSGIAPDSGL